jgi:hypothetical protein
MISKIVFLSFVGMSLFIQPCSAMMPGELECNNTITVSTSSKKNLFESLPIHSNDTRVMPPLLSYIFKYILGDTAFLNDDHGTLCLDDENIPDVFSFVRTSSKHKHLLKEGFSFKNFTINFPKDPDKESLSCSLIFLRLNTLRLLGAKRFDLPSRLSVRLKLPYIFNINIDGLGLNDLEEIEPLSLVLTQGSNYLLAIDQANEGNPQIPRLLEKGAPPVVKLSSSGVLPPEDLFKKGKGPTTLNVSFHEAPTEGYVLFLAQRLREQSCIRHLFLSSFEKRHKLIEAAASNPYLRSLTLEENVTEEDIAALRAATYNPSLRLRANHLQLPNDLCEKFHLTSAYGGYGQYRVDPEHLDSLIEGIPSDISYHLNLDIHNLKQEHMGCLAKLIGMFPGGWLGLAGTDSIGDDELEILQPGLSRNPSVDVWLWENKISISKVRELSKSARISFPLDLRQIPLTDPEIENLPRILEGRENVKQLIVNWRDLKIQENLLDFVFDAFQGCFIDIKENINPEEAKALRPRLENAIQRSKNINLSVDEIDAADLHINLSVNGIDAARELKDSGASIQVDLSGQAMTDKNLDLLANLLKQGEFYTSISLRDCELMPQHRRFINRILKTRGSGHRIDLSHNKLGDTIARDVARFVKKHPAMKVNLFGNPITPSVLAELLEECPHTLCSTDEFSLEEYETLIP